MGHGWKGYPCLATEVRKYLKHHYVDDRHDWVFEKRAFMNFVRVMRVELLQESRIEEEYKRESFLCDSSKAQAGVAGLTKVPYIFKRESQVPHSRLLRCVPTFRYYNAARFSARHKGRWSKTGVH